MTPAIRAVIKAMGDHLPIEEIEAMARKLSRVEMDELDEILEAEQIRRGLRTVIDARPKGTQ